MRIVVLADTHIPGFAKSLPATLIPALRRADLILHAGDVNAAWVLQELADFAPVRAVVGNNDDRDVAAWGAPEELRLELEGLNVAMIHDSGPSDGRERRLAARFPEARLVVFGHSHIPLNYSERGVRLFNPGSPTWKRRQPSPTYGRITVGERRIRQARIVELAP